MKGAFSILFIILLCGCVHRDIAIDDCFTAKTTTVSKVATDWVYLIKQMAASNDTLLRDEDSKYVIFSTEVNHRKIAVVAVTDSFLFLYERTNNKWLRLDSVRYDTYAETIDKVNLNKDSIPDLIINGMGNMNGQQQPFVFISDINGLLHSRPDIRLFNIRYNRELKLVQSYYGGGNNSNMKELYKWDGDSLLLVRGVEQIREERYWKVNFYTQKNGKKTIYRATHDDGAEIYDTAVFEGDYY